MSLDSTENFSIAYGGNVDNEPFQTNDPELEFCPLGDGISSWCYLYVHHFRVDSVVERISKEFNVFIHKTTVFKRKKSHVREEEHPTISGLVFIQGEVARIQAFLKEYFPGIYLVNDCSTKVPAVIPDRVMQPFINLSQVEPHRIRFMSHPVDYYASGHSLVKITSGILKGMEGYQVRISRDRCLITAMGNMTIAIGGINKETFENLPDTYSLSDF